MDEVDYMYLNKYIPSGLDQVILDDDIRVMLESYLSKDTICNLILSGNPGIGKSTITNCITQQLNSQTLFVNASFDNGVDFIRTTVARHCNMMCAEGKIKVIVFSEANRLTEQAQDALKDIIEADMDDTRFIFTTNELYDINEAIRSRCTIVTPTYAMSDVVVRVKHILDNEKVEYTEDNFKAFYDTVVKPQYPDIRSIIKNLENSTITGELKLVSVNKADDELGELTEFIKANIAKPVTIRYKVIQKYTGNWESLATALYRAYYDSPVVMMTIGQNLPYFKTVLDKEVLFDYIIVSISEALK